MNTDLSNKTIEELTTGFPVFVGNMGCYWVPIENAKELARRLEEAQQKIVEQQAMAVELYQSLNFYADPGTWFAVMLVPDYPAGQIMEDFSETELDQKPGDLARRICEKYKDQRLDELADINAKIVAQQARIAEQSKLIDQLIDTDGADVLLAAQVLAKTDDMSLLAAHDAEMKAEALEEAKAKITDAEYFFPKDLAYLSKKLDEWAAEYRAKAKGD